MNVSDSLASCRERLKAAAEKHRLLAVMLVHRATIGDVPKPYWPGNWENQGCYHYLHRSRGPSAPAERLCFDDGMPAPSYQGVLRDYQIYVEKFQGSDETTYAESVSEYLGIANELGSFLKELPTEVHQVIWQDWIREPLIGPEPANLWINAIFELAWQNHSGSGLAAKRLVWHEDKEVSYPYPPQLREAGSPFHGVFTAILKNAGDPPSYWYSWMDNIWRASISAIDLLRFLAEQKTSKAALESIEDASGEVR